MMMAMSCIVMANLPTYAQVGISAAWVVTICRIVQGLSSMGEIMGAQVYITEITTPPVQYPAVSFIVVASATGAVFALGVATLVTSIGFNWRIAFWIGACIAVIGSIARTRLRETPEFVTELSLMKVRKESKKAKGIDSSSKNKNIIEKINFKSSLAFLTIEFGWPICFYLVYMFFNPLLKSKFGYTSENIIFHNFMLSILQLSAVIFLAFISFKYHPLKILYVVGSIFLVLMSLLPIIINSITNYMHIFLIQALVLIFAIGSMPASSIFIKNFPVLRRVTATSFLYALSRALMYVVTSFGLVYLTEFYGHYGLWIITLPVAISFLWAISHYARLENVVLPKFFPTFGRKKEEMLKIRVLKEKLNGHT
jgi:MFS family permease